MLKSILENLNEQKINTGEIMEILFEVLIGEHGRIPAEKANDWIQENMVNSEYYEPNEPETYYLEVMSDESLEKMYNEIKGYL